MPFLCRACRRKERAGEGSRAGNPCAALFLRTVDGAESKMSSNPANVNRVAADRFSRLKALQRPASLLQTKIGTDATGNHLEEVPSRSPGAAGSERLRTVWGA